MNKWGVGAKIWFTVIIIAQWFTFINEITKPAFAYRADIRQAALVAAIVGAIGTALYLWLAVGKKKAALVTILIMGAINVAVPLFQGDVSTALLTCIAPTITWLVSRHVVTQEFAPAQQTYHSESDSGILHPGMYSPYINN